jgi:hypothetical protein
LLAAVRLFDRYKKYQQWRSDVKAGFDEIERGEGVELADDTALHTFFGEIERRARERLAASQSE